MEMITLMNPTITTTLCKKKTIWKPQQQKPQPISFFKYWKSI